MDNSALYELIETVAHVDAARGPAEKTQTFRRVLERYGFSHFLITGLTVAHDSHWQRGIICDGWPAEWFEHYRQYDYFRHDPCVARSRRASRPFFWDEIDRSGLRKNALTVMNEAGEFGLKNGVCFPIHVPLAGPAVVTAAGECIEIPSQALPLLETLCVHVFRSLSEPENEGAADMRPCLTSREREVLQWAAAGKTAEDVSTILDLKRNTVESHHKHIREKYGACNLPHAIAIAIRRGEIEI